MAKALNFFLVSPKKTCNFAVFVYVCISMPSARLIKKLKCSHPVAHLIYEQWRARIDGHWPRLGSCHYGPTTQGCAPHPVGPSHLAKVKYLYGLYSSKLFIYTKIRKSVSKPMLNIYIYMLNNIEPANFAGPPLVCLPPSLPPSLHFPSSTIHSPFIHIESRRSKGFSVIKNGSPRNWKVLFKH